MPIYEFQCAACGHRFDRLQKMSDPDPTECPVCAQAQISRQVTAPSFRLAGAGWYETDFKRDGDKKRNLAGSDDAPKSDSASTVATAPASSGKSDAPTAPTTPAKSESSAPKTAPPTSSGGDA
ncbi:MAG: FmdB family zinc ribbon protein [Tahibacter sp.]